MILSIIIFHQWKRLCWAWNWQKGLARAWQIFGKLYVNDDIFWLWHVYTAHYSMKSLKMRTCQILWPWLGGIVNSGIGLSYRPAGLCSLAGRHDSHILQSRTKNLAAGRKAGNSLVVIGRQISIAVSVAWYHWSSCSVMLISRREIFSCLNHRKVFSFLNHRLYHVWKNHSNLRSRSTISQMMVRPIL